MKDKNTYKTPLSFYPTKINNLKKNGLQTTILLFKYSTFL